MNGILFKHGYKRRFDKGKAKSADYFGPIKVDTQPFAEELA